MHPSDQEILHDDIGYNTRIGFLIISFIAEDSSPGVISNFHHMIGLFIKGRYMIFFFLLPIVQLTPSSGLINSEVHVCAVEVKVQ